MTGHDDEPRWGVDEVAAFLKVPKETIYQWRKRDYGPPAAPVGRYLRYDPNDVREWFHDQKRAA